VTPVPAHIFCCFDLIKAPQSLSRYCTGIVSSINATAATMVTLQQQPILALTDLSCPCSADVPAACLQASWAMCCCQLACHPSLSGGRYTLSTAAGQHS
jgi:hypothetical protein